MRGKAPLDLLKQSDYYLGMKTKKKTQPENYPQSISEAYELLKQVLLSDDKKLIDKMWKFLNEAEGDWAWVRVKLLTDCYGSADAKGKEEFCLIALDQHIKNGTAIPLAKLFVDEETQVEYLEYLMSDLIIYRVPISADDMDKYAFEKALEKKFIGDFIETRSVDGTTYTLLDTQEKVGAYNSGTFYEKYVYGKNLKKNTIHQ
jgi:hypothetical protein